MNARRRRRSALNADRFALYLLGGVLLVAASLAQVAGEEDLSLVLYVAATGPLVLPWALGGPR